ncbi:MAG: SRPBCC domain-containing protein [Alphaproteobacteria bacterium]|nr:SRPBCC domain-containing protein [Alphaproteobacteria bacterium]MBL6936252.1 SRPBCC domain-containing protein [Alphaproteobacteria bacterium]MBL7098697.1 SRPBCC domain-containing protein [Alphaproteobacteria bacterium]
MNTQIEIPPREPIIVMSRIYDAPRDLLWRVLTDKKHVAKWWGGPGAKNRIKEMDVRPGGLWTHHMTFPNGDGIQMDFVFTVVEEPTRLGWKHVDYDTRKEGPPPIDVVVALDALARDRTRWTMTARFPTLAGRDQSVEFGFTRPIEASNDMLLDYLKTVEAAQ